MLVIEEFCVVLVMMYLLLCDIVDVIIFVFLYEVIVILYYDLWIKFGIVELCILVCGLNLYVGEGGYMGMEEIDIIILVFNELWV